MTIIRSYRWWGAILAILLASSVLAAKRPFTVADSIAVTQITDPPAAYLPYMPLDFNWSPDHRWVAMITRRGELSTGLNHYELRVFSEQELKEVVRANRSPKRPPGRTVLSIATSSYRHGIERIGWDRAGRFIYCIAREGESVAQVHEIEIETGRRRKLTSHATDVRSYTVSADGLRLLYLAHEPQDWTERNRRGYVFGANMYWDLSIHDSRVLDDSLASYLQNTRTGEVRRLDLALASWPWDFFLSPDGRSAIHPAQVRALKPEWRDYEFFRRYRELSEQSLLDMGTALAPVAEVNGLDPTFGIPAATIAQYHVIDLETGDARPLMHAPALLHGWPQIHWSATDRSVIVSHSYLPLAGVGAEEAAHRRSTMIIAEIDVGTGAVLPIADLPEFASDGVHRLDLRGIERLPDGSVEIGVRASTEMRDTVTRYVKVEGRWTSASTRTATQRVAMIDLEIRQGSNTPPDVFVVDPQTGRGVRITNLNPQLDQLALGHVEPFEWEDRFGRRFRGGLFLPPGYVSGRRLPVVLQTYGFRDDDFVIDGPNLIPNGYSARALINRGMLVLQMPELTGTSAIGEGDFEQTGENPRYVAGLEAAIDELDRRGYIDPNKVGLIGFSREGMHVEYSVTFGARPIAAAVISDSASATPLCYSLLHGLPLPAMTEFERNGIIGAPFWGTGIELWKERSPVFHLDRIRTPIRFETMGTAVLCSWDIYANLTRHRRPVELVHIPSEIHPIQTPWARYTSQQGTVDWFDFWLNGREDPDPAKKAQYERWRVFRQQQAIANGAALPTSSSR